MPGRPLWLSPRRLEPVVPDPQAVKTKSSRLALFGFLAVVGLAACSSDDPLSTTTHPSSDSTADTSVSTTEPVATTAATTPTTTTVDCEAFGATEEVRVAFPERMSSLYGNDIRTGTHDCFERLVIEFAGTGDFPGYWVRYTDDPIPLGMTDDQFVDLDGNVAMVVSIAAWMGEFDDPWTESRIDPKNVENVVDLYMSENFEGQMAWAVGLDSKRPFRVETLANPSRLVIDFLRS